MILSFETQFSYTEASLARAINPLSVSRDPIKTRSGCKRSWTAVPSARNSGFDRISNLMVALEFASRMRRIDSAVLQGTVDFSTTIFEEVATRAIRRVAASMNERSEANPAPIPLVFVGVFTDTKMISARLMHPSTSVEKKRFLPRHCCTMASRPGSYTGRESEFHCLILSSLMSTMYTLTWGHFRAMTAQVGPPGVRGIGTDVTGANTANREVRGCSSEHSIRCCCREKARF